MASATQIEVRFSPEAIQSKTLVLSELDFIVDSIIGFIGLELGDPIPVMFPCYICLNLKVSSKVIFSFFKIIKQELKGSFAPAPKSLGRIRRGKGSDLRDLCLTRSIGILQAKRANPPPKSWIFYFSFLPFGRTIDHMQLSHPSITSLHLFSLVMNLQRRQTKKRIITKKIKNKKK